ncbi:uncharacterized protein LOC131859148 [Cryptomeria japonica]|uniref:uncharacterized protein LOC131859148 n=1 Tax=Cryptomeria japonica TaxID=3369 RepID=UPI0027DAA39D|nr:uncharacterized protein LOC131859148 [Cryptomeria japonica]
MEVVQLEQIVSYNALSQVLEGVIIKVDKKKKRSDIVEEQTAKVETSSAPPSSGKGKKNQKRGQQLILQEESDGNDIEEEPKKVKATGKKAKPIESTSQSIPIKALSYKPMTNFERMINTLGRNRNIIEPDKKPPSISLINAVDIPSTQPSVDIPPPPVKDQQVKSQLPPISQATQEKPIERVAENSSEQEKEKDQDKTKKEKSAEPKKALVNQQNDDNDDLLGIKEPIYVDNMSASGLLEIAIVMQSRA